jgi:hypothetical protein
MTLRRLGWGCIISLLMLSGVATGFAQEALTQPIDLDNGYTIALPDDWFAEHSENTAAYYFTSSQGEISGFIIDPVSLRVEVPTVIQSDLENALIEVYNTLISSSRVRSRDVEFLELGGFPAAGYRFEEVFDGTTYEDILFILQFDEGEFGALIFSALPGALDDEDNAALIRRIAATFAPAGQSSISVSNGNSTGESSGLSSAFGSAFGNNSSSQTNTTVSIEPCLVSTNEADTVQLRVGPGFNRAVVLFLPTGDEYDVIGTFTTDAGDEWFQLIKDEVAPESGASELWVLREDVNESGECDSVGDASAPPIVPILSNPPPVTVVPGETTTTNTTAGLIIPTGGVWTLTYNSQGDASCAGTESFHVSQQDISLTPVLTGNLAVSNGGDTFSYYGVIYTRVPGSNNFRGLASFSDGTSNESFATLTSSTSLVGSDIFNVTFDGNPCSATFGFSARLG